MSSANYLIGVHHDKKQLVGKFQQTMERLNTPGLSMMSQNIIKAIGHAIRIDSLNNAVSYRSLR